ncbi:hypothetical protein UFOVP207_21 [uncultured Caudovirales phage]|uniref:Uncharacterized protein n=1 Tax=uncultured Caudovirales phage TaxID=2100421 RepID=A0A6J7WM10_9CAUD|nr:hypothetical protein UFOVP207_21 [uncultured Caudovirales phage]
MSVDNLIKDMQELKKTKLYSSSFKAIDDCIFLAEYSKKEQRNQIIRAVNYSIMNLDKLREQAIKENVTIGEIYIRIELDKIINKCL